ncbi:hypothetical protein V6N13_042726 [Hibiscus sabdariffa]
MDVVETIMVFAANLHDSIAVKEIAISNSNVSVSCPSSSPITSSTCNHNGKSGTSKAINLACQYETNGKRELVQSFRTLQEVPSSIKSGNHKTVEISGDGTEHVHNSSSSKSHFATKALKGTANLPLVVTTRVTKKGA